MRTRMLVGLSVAVVVLLGAGALAAVWGGGPSPEGAFRVEVARLPLDQPRAVTVERSGAPHGAIRLFVVRRGPQADAFRAVSTHLGCRVLLAGEVDGIGGTSASAEDAFEDPCGGSVFSLSGDCVGGPCPRGLDRYPTRVHDGSVEIDLTRLVKGPPRGT